MSMTASNIRYYTDRERVAYQKISGMNEVLSANPADMEKVSAKYPDAVFAIMIHEEMICRVAGIRNIVRKAHAAILEGEGIENVRFHYTKEMDEYFREHTWDDLIKCFRILLFGSTFCVETYIIYLSAMNFQFSRSASGIILSNRCASAIRFLLPKWKKKNSPTPLLYPN